jgi:endonuclease-8/formamidopyrimidine-DNA glycosylase
MMSDGVRDGRIITTPPRYWNGSDGVAPGGGGSPGPLPAPEESHFVYRRQGLDCRDCGTPVALAELAARKLYWCPACQAP